VQRKGGQGRRQSSCEACTPVSSMRTAACLQPKTPNMNHAPVGESGVCAQQSGPSWLLFPATVMTCVLCCVMLCCAPPQAVSGPVPDVGLLEALIKGVCVSLQGQGGEGRGAGSSVEGIAVSTHDVSHKQQL
jgi:hypothetical protein